MNFCVFCGSRPGARPEYVVQARALGKELVRRGIGLVYGGAGIGVMGALADAVMTQGGTVVGVMPQRLVDREIAHPRLSEMHIVGSMHERKALMEKLSDGFIALPGGFGTFEELFEIITWSQLGLHQKPIGILDVAGYYAPVRQLLQSGVAEGFIPPEHPQRIQLESDVSTLLDRMLAYTPPPAVPKWINRSET
jgi:uncharacterized protein (TIGR00730 family)